MDEPGKENPTEENSEKKIRKKRDPFKNMDQVFSTEAGLRARDLAKKTEIKQIKKANIRHEGQKVVTDDVKKLKSLTVEPELPGSEYINSYAEPVRIEYYIPKESRFAVEYRNLYIPLIDPVPRDVPDDAILRLHVNENRFLDLMDVMNDYPLHITDILESYSSTLSLFESLSRAYKEAVEGSPESYRSAFYLCECLIEYEPTLAALNFLGMFQAWNLNWLIRMMNSMGVSFSASDKTISYLIKQRNIYWEENDLAYDERFEILAALFYEQAYPNRGLTYEEEDYFLDIFDKKH